MLEDAVRLLTGLPESVAILAARIDGIEAKIRHLEVSLREEMRAGDEETRRFMRILHEDLVARLALISERLH